MTALGIAVVWTLALLLLERGGRPWMRRWPLGSRHLGLASTSLGLALLGAMAGLWSWPLAGLLGLGAGPLGLALASFPFLLGSRAASYGWRRGSLQRPDPSRPLLLVADPHWDASLADLQATTARHPDADWLFLGDAFDLWIALPGLETPAQEAFLGWVAERRAAGRWVGFWSGNHEFFLWARAHHFDLAGEGTGACLAEGLAFEHGDLILGPDWRYRLLNVVLRSGPVSLLVRGLPRTWVAAFARNLAARLALARRPHGGRFPQEAFRRAAARSAGKAFVTGHFHVDVTEGKGRTLPWAHDGIFACWEGGEVRLLASGDRDVP